MEELNSTLSFFEGGSFRAIGHNIMLHAALELWSETEILLQNENEPVEMLLLQSLSIGAPIAHYGLLFLNTLAEL